jgi:hypothetical protein
MPLLGLSDDILALVAAALMPAGNCDAYACDALRAVCGSCRALRALFAGTCGAFVGAYVVADSPRVCAAAHRAGLLFDPRALGARVARDFALLPRMRSLVSSSLLPSDVSLDVRPSALLDCSSVEMYTGLLLRCAALDASAQWTRRVTELRVHGSWLGTCSEIAAFTNLGSLALVECRCHTVAGLDELHLDSLTVDALAFYAGHSGRYVGPVVDVGADYLAPLLRARRLFVRRTPALATMFATS